MEQTIARMTATASHTAQNRDEGRIVSLPESSMDVTKRTLNISRFATHGINSRDSSLAMRPGGFSNAASSSEALANREVDHCTPVVKFTLCASSLTSCLNMR